MIHLDELKALADKIQAMAQEKKDKKGTDSLTNTALMGEAVGLSTACAEVWKFINEQQLKSLS